VTAGRRVGAAVSAGLVAGVALAFVTSWQIAIVSGWDVAAVVVLAASWLSIWKLDGEGTGSRATEEDSSRAAAELVILGASLASLCTVGLVLAEANNETGAAKALHTAAGVVTIALSWAVVHTVFMLRYAHEYYSPPVGGIDFKTQKEAPDYRDFAYVAFTVGMTFQVSDTDIQQQAVRRTVLRHALIAYLLGAVVIAVTINLVATLFS
jgi:uncharacterized membrane protein